MRIEIPEQHRSGTVTVPPEDTPKNAVMVRTGYSATVYSDEEGRYVGVHPDKAKPIMDRMERDYGVNYDRDSKTLTEEISDVMTPDRRQTLAKERSDNHWNAVVAAVKSGECDEYLGELESVEVRNSVLEAIEERQELLE